MTHQALAMTADIVCAHVSNNTVAVGDVATLINSVYDAISQVGADKRTAMLALPEYTPAVSIKKSLASADHIVSMIDGKPYRMLKRHLATNRLTPDQYRERYGLPANYPMVAAEYSAKRREIAITNGLGRKGY
jgi:predicted transcriptional regulator